MKPARPVHLFDLPPARRKELQAAIDRHPAVAPGQVAGQAAPPGPTSVRGCAGSRDRWRCHLCGEVFEATDSGAKTADPFATVEDHRHQNDFGGEVGVIDLVME